MTPSFEIVDCHALLSGGELVLQLGAPRPVSHVLVRDSGTVVSDDAVRRLLEASRAPLAASASPIDCKSAPSGDVCVVESHPALPPVPSLGLPCVEACVVSTAALQSIVMPCVATDTSWREALALVSQRLMDVGWRHVAAPGTALAWRSARLAPGAISAGWSDAVVDALSGPGNEGLAAHRLWVETRLRPVRVIIDGNCLTDDPHNGTQAIVVNVTRWLKRARPEAHVTLAVKDRFVRHLSDELAGDGIDVVSRDAQQRRYDVVYRPYQMLDPSELVWLGDAGRRVLVGQLDMIGFSNPSYHPSPALFHAVRNLQRHVMRAADGVTFISEFGRATALAECAGVSADRTFVVSCGAGSEPTDDVQPDAAVSRLQDFVLCLSATFWHKNRTHAIRVFGELCANDAYEGSLVIAGPEPFYGRSIATEEQVIAALPADVARRVIRMGQIDEGTKWWLLRRAQLVLYPSVVEGFGMIPFEAASVGTPSLSYAGSGLLEVVGESSALVAAWDVSDWAKAAAGILRSAEESASVVAAIHRAAAAHTWREVAESTWTAIDATIARPRASRLVEEGGHRSRVTSREALVSPTARAVHFGNRLLAYARRRFNRSEAGAR